MGKKPEEIKAALKADILLFNLESSQELEEINRIAGRLKMKARVALRINPDIDAQTHPYISTGLKKNKFGIDIEQALNDYRRALDLPHLEVVGVACHIGSQITEVAPFVDALERLKELIDRLRALGIQHPLPGPGRRPGDSIRRRGAAPPGRVRPASSWNTSRAFSAPSSWSPAGCWWATPASW